MKRIAVFMMLIFVVFLSVSAKQWGRDGAWCRKDDTWSRYFSGNGWAMDMLNSYKILHETLPDGVEEELYARLLPGGYLYSTFGPGGQNKSVCDFVLAFKQSATAGSGTTTKTSGAALRWDMPGVTGSPITQNNMPANDYGATIVTVSSTDGWNAITSISLTSEHFTGQFPNLKSVGFNSLNLLDIRNNQDLTVNTSLISQITSLTTFKIYNISGDLIDLAGLSLIHLDASYTETKTYNISGSFVSAGLLTCILYNANLTELEVDNVLGYYAAISGSLDMTKNYVINLGGDCAAPSAAGIANYKTLMNLAWTTGSMTITITGMGGDLMAGWDFTDVAWIDRGTGSDFDSNTIVSGAVSGGGIRIDDYVNNVGKNYLLRIAGDVDASTQIYPYNISGSIYTIPIGSFNKVFVFTSPSTGFAFVINGVNKTLNVDNFTLYQLD